MRTRARTWLRVVSSTVFGLLVSSAVAIPMPASAGTLPTEVNIRLSAQDTATMSHKSYWWTNEPASRSFVKFVEAGANLTLRYRVTNTFDQGVADVPLTIQKTNAVKTTYLEFQDTDSVTQNTDANGYATFVFHNTTSNDDAEPRPVSPSSMTWWDDQRGPLINNDFSVFDFTPTVGLAPKLDADGKVIKNYEHIDRVWSHTVKTTNIPVAYIRLSDSDKAAMTDKSYWWTNEPESFSLVKFVESGTPMSLNYTVTNNVGAPITNTLVTLAVVSDGTTTFSGGLTGYTDSQGKVTFTLTSTTPAANAEPRPYGLSNMNYWDDSWHPSVETKFEINPSIGAGVEHVDRVWTHTVKPASLSLPVANIRLTDVSKASMTDKSYWWGGLPASDKAFVKFVEAGTDLVLQYRVTSAAGAAIPNVSVALVPTNGNATFSGPLTGTTDDSGYVTFTLRSTTSAANAEPRPVAPSSMSYWDDSRSVDTPSTYDLLPTVGALSERVDRVWTHTVKPAAARPVIRLVSPVLDTTKDAYDATSWLSGAGLDADTKAFVRYYSAGSQLLLRYRATMSDTGAGIANQTMSLTVNGNNEATSYVAGSTTIASGTKVVLTATTDANGYATFSLVNTNTAADAEPVPAALNQPNASWPGVQLGGNIVPSLGDATGAVDILFPHITKPIESVKTGTAAAPVITKVTPGNGTLAITFTAGKAGTSATKYYGYSLDGGTTWVDNSKNTKSPLTITGLSNGITYAVKLRAWNTTGAGASSAVAAGTPVAAKPSAPKITSAIGGAGQITIAFTPGYDGGAPITRYEVSIDGGKTYAPASPAVLASPIVVSGLGYAVKYAVNIRAVNSSGAGTASSGKSVTTIKIPQTITFVQPAAMKVGAADQTLTYSVSSGLSLTVSASTSKVCTLVAGKLRAIGAGTCTVTVAQAGTSMYAAATTIARKVTITK